MKEIKIRSLCVISINVIGVIGLIYFAIPFLVHDTRIVNPNAMLPAEAWDWAGMILTFGLVPLLIANGFGFFFVRGKRKTVRFLFFIPSVGVPGDRVSLLDSGDGYGVRIMVILLILFLLVIIVCLLYRTMDKAYERQIAAYQNKLLKNQVDEVHNMYLTMRGWRHDYHNHMQSVKAYLAMDSLDEARAYLDRLEQDLDDIDLLFHTGNINADAILNSKISLAIRKGIQVDYKATVPKELAVSDIDLCVVIGNLIDNAVEACEKVEPQHQFIRLYIGILRRQLYISVSNATGEAVRKLDEEYITTKRGNHGHGLKRINNIVNKYDGYINRKNEPGVFVTEIMLPI